MWDLRIAVPFGRLSIRKLLACAATMFVAAFAYIVFTAPTTYAAEASWSGANISYDGNLYTGPTTLPAGNNTGIPADAKVYTYLESASDGSTQQKAHIIYFEASNDPSNATSAKYVEYLYTPPGSYTNPSNAKDITVDASGYGKGATSCAVKGIGWLICTISNFLADGMDWIFDTLRTFVEVKPLGLGKGDLYQAWDVMRGFANVAFIIAFMIVIYSQVTSIGISNYGIKKIMPRLVVAALLVNLSYYICAIAIDLSNIAGMSLQGLLINLRDQIFHVSSDSTLSQTLNAPDWKELTAFILSGGTAAGVGVIAGLSATGGTILGAVYALVPILIGLFIIVLMVLIILAARQAIIIMLVIVAPLAFVAYLLPGTEKWFKKWHETFTAMLVFFPIFSLIFGGSQLAGGIIIQNAQSIVMILFGMAVQIAPLAIAPLVMRFSTGILGKIAGMVNNPRKGLADRAKNMASEQQEKHRQRGIGENLSRRNVMRRAARRLEMGKRNTARDTERYKQGFEEYAAKKTATDKFRQKVELDLEVSKLNTENWQAQGKRAIAEFRAGDTSSLTQLQELGEGQGFIGRKRTNAAESIRRRIGRPTRYDDVALEALSKAAVTADQESRITSQAIQVAEHEQQARYTDALLHSGDMRRRSGGISPKGADSILAGAVAKERSDYVERVKEKAQLIKHFNPGGEKLQDLALGGTIEVVRDGVEYTFKGDDMHAREAAIEEKLKTGSFGDIETIIKESANTVTTFKRDENGRVINVDTHEGQTHGYETTISQLIAELKLQNKAAFFGGITIDDISLGKVNGDVGLDNAAVRSLMTGKISAQALAGMNAKAVERLFFAAQDPSQSEYYQDEAAKNPAAARAALEESFRQLRYAAYEVRNNTSLKGIPDDAAAKVLDKIQLPPPPSSTP